MYSKFGQFRDGSWQQSSDGKTYEVINPATEEIIGKASKASPEDVDKALISAQKGFLVWKKFSPWERSSIIRKNHSPPSGTANPPTQPGALPPPHPSPFAA